MGREGGITEGFDDFFGAFGAVFVFLHGAADLEIGDEIPPLPGLAGGALVGDLEDAELAEILGDHLLTVVALGEVLLRVGCAVAAVVDALRLALLALDERLRAIPRDVVRGELRVATSLQQLRHALEVTHEVHLRVALGPALVVAVGPELVLHALVRVRQRLPPVQLHHHQLVGCHCLLQLLPEVLLDERRWDGDVLQVLRCHWVVVWRVHGYEFLLLVVHH